MDHHLRYRIYLIKRRSVSDNALGSLSKDVFERCTSTGSVVFAFFVSGFARICIGNSMICSDIWHEHHE